jgi:hypothetical protein
MGVRAKLQRTPIVRSRRAIALDKVRGAWNSAADQVRRDDSSAKAKAGVVVAGIAGIATAALVAARKIASRGDEAGAGSHEPGAAEESAPQADANGERRPVGITGQ